MPFLVVGQAYFAAVADVLEEAREDHILIAALDGDTGGRFGVGVVVGGADGCCHSNRN